MRHKESLHFPLISLSLSISFLTSLSPIFLRFYSLSSLSSFPPSLSLSHRPLSFIFLPFFQFPLFFPTSLSFSLLPILPYPLPPILPATKVQPIKFVLFVFYSLPMDTIGERKGEEEKEERDKRRRLKERWRKGKRDGEKKKGEGRER